MLYSVPLAEDPSLGATNHRAHGPNVLEVLCNTFHTNGPPAARELLSTQNEEVHESTSWGLNSFRNVKLSLATPETSREKRLWMG